MTVSLNTILDNLIKMAKEDGNVSVEEEKFLSKLKKDILEFQKAAEKAKKDNKIDEYEFNELLILRDKLLTDSLQFETGSEDVNHLIEELYNEINDFKIPGQNNM